MIVGGYDGEDTNKVEVLDLVNNEYVSVQDRLYKAFDSGVYYDEINELIHVGGG